MASDVNKGPFKDPTLLQPRRKRLSNVEMESTPMDTEEQKSSSQIVEESPGDETKSATSVYDTLKLGLLMTLMTKLSNNVRVAVLTTIYLTTFLSGFDTTSDS